MFRAALVTITKIWKQSRYKGDAIPHNGILAIKTWNSAICKNMDGHRGYYTSEISQAEKDKHDMLSCICRI